MKDHSETAKFAVDFVILPPDHVMDIAISINRRACKDSYIALDRQKCFPHVSLLMGCLGADHLKEVELMLNSIVSQRKAMTLNVTHIRTVNSSMGDIITLDIDPHNDLQLLHESMVKAIGPRLSKDATEADVFDPHTNASTLGWINGFISDSCFENFWPHITVGYAKENIVAEEIEPFTFTASRVAMCHIGNYCTCKKIFSETLLAK